MKWNKLLCKERVYWPLDLDERQQPHADALIDVFQNDSSRITSSSAYHRLQRKTQVLPFPKSDYPRSRLTHTNEVSDCGRELARLIGRRLEDNEDVKFDARQTSEMEDVVSAACKAHDIGNPPFGHSGEFAIQTWVREHVSTEDAGKFTVSKEKYAELCKFDGNGQGFRILTQMAGWRGQGGLQLSAAVLAAFCKYPWTALDAPKNKYSVPMEARELAEYVFGKVGMIPGSDDAGRRAFYRHPLAYIVEAADDISYITSDLEDAARADVGSFQVVLKFLERIAKKAYGDDAEQHNHYMDRLEYVRNQGPKAHLRYLKDHAQRALKVAATNAFIDRYRDIMKGELTGSLLDNSNLGALIDEAKDYMKENIYDNVGKVRHEVFGARVITELLEFYFTTLFAAHDEVANGKTLDCNGDTIDEVLRRGLITFPLDNYTGQKNWRDMTAKFATYNSDQLAQMVVDYVSGMTDQYAVSIYQQITGIQRPDATW